MRVTGGTVRYWNQMSARSCWEAGEAEILKPNACRKLLRGTGAQEKFGYWNSIKARSCGEANEGKPTYETKWMQEVERHIGGRESLILEQDERNKLLRVDGWSLDIEPTSAAGNEDRHGQMCKRTGEGCSWVQWSQLRVPHESTSKSM